MTGWTDRVLGDPRLYDRVQRIFGVKRLVRRVADVLATSEPGIVLDVGAGTACFFPSVPATFAYIALDVDSRKLARAREKFPALHTVQGSGTDLPFDDDAVDYTLCINVAHHLDDQELMRLIDELRRVTRRRLVFLDPLFAPRLASHLLWALDRGSHPRRAAVLREALERGFAMEQLDLFKIFHTYVLAVAAPRPGGPTRSL